MTPMSSDFFFHQRLVTMVEVEKKNFPIIGVALISKRYFNVGEHVITYTGKFLTNAEANEAEEQYKEEGKPCCLLKVRLAVLRHVICNHGTNAFTEIVLTGLTYIHMQILILNVVSLKSRHFELIMFCIHVIYRFHFLNLTL